MHIHCHIMKEKLTHFEPNFVDLNAKLWPGSRETSIYRLVCTIFSPGFIHVPLNTVFISGLDMTAGLFPPKQHEYLSLISGKLAGNNRYHVCVSFLPLTWLLNKTSTRLLILLLVFLSLSLS